MRSGGGGEVEEVGKRSTEAETADMRLAEEPGTAEVGRQRRRGTGGGKISWGGV